MTVSSRCYLFEDGGFIKRISRRVVDALIFGKDAIPEYANTVQRVAEIRIENDDGKPITILEAIGYFWTFDAEGKIDKGLQRGTADLMDLAFRRLPPANSKVVSLDPALKKKRFQEKHRWEVSKEQLDLIAADLWPTVSISISKIPIASGKAERKPPVTYEPEQALREFHLKIATMKSDLERLSEPALKGISFAARANSDFPGDLWHGLAVDCDTRREILARHRTGRGTWYAVIEAISSTGPDTAHVDDIAFEKCEGRKAAVSAARRMLREHADKFAENTSLEARLYCDLEWQPSDERDASSPRS